MPGGHCLRPPDAQGERPRVCLFLVAFGKPPETGTPAFRFRWRLPTGFPYNPGCQVATVSGHPMPRESVRGCACFWWLLGSHQKQAHPLSGSDGACRPDSPITRDARWPLSQATRCPGRASAGVPVSGGFWEATRNRHTRFPVPMALADRIPL